MRAQLPQVLHHAWLERLVDLEPHVEEWGPVMARPVEVFDPWNAPQSALQRGGHLAFPLRRARTRERIQNIHHRNDYLWLFLARSEEHGEDAEDNRSEQHERRELAT